MKVKLLTSILLMLSSLSFNMPGAGEARSSGGRSGGGSFRSSPSRSAPSRPSTNRTYEQPQRNNNTIVPIFIPGANNNNYSNNPNNFRNSSSSSDGSWLIWLMVILGVGGLGLIVYLILRKFMIKGSELDNDQVTVTKLQVALLAEARVIQGQLDQISLQANTDTLEGLTILLQESAIALLRMPENWSHVLSSSQSVKRDQAESIFNSLSVTERSKFVAETLVNVGGNVRTQSFNPNPEDDPAAYIVVTLLIGTEHDQPLFGEVKSREALQTALEKIAAIPSSHLLIFELLWSPQAQGDSVSSDELLTEYTTMVQI